MPLTKAQILSNLALLPLNKLETLDAYAQHLIVPQEDLLVNVNMTQMRDKVFALGVQYFPEWTDKSPADFGTFLAELFCLFSEKDFWYLNAFANQTLLSNMSVYSIAFIRAVELGFRPQLLTAGTASFDIVFVPGSLFVYAEGELVVELTGGIKFTNTAPLTVPLSGVNFTYPLYLQQGEYFKDSASFNGHSVDIRKAGIDIKTIILTVNGILWSRVNVFGDSGSSSLHYMVLPEEDGKVSIFFGEDGYGKVPELSDVVEVKYMITTGSASNITTPLALTVKKDNSSRATVGAGCLMTSPSVGGFDASTLEQLKFETPNYFNYRKSCLNDISTLTWLLDQPEVGAAYVTTVGSSVSYSFITNLGGIPTVSEIAVIQNRIAPLVSNGFTITYNPTTYISTAPIVLDLYYLNGYNPAEIISLAAQVIQDYTDPLIRSSYGKDFNLTDLTVLILSSVPGTQNVVYLSIAGGAPANIPVLSKDILSKATFAGITINPIVIL